MKILNDILADLREKKLWIPAAVLLALIVGVPFTLAKAGDPPVETVAAPVLPKEDEGPSLSLTRAATTAFARPARVNDDRLDPFASRAKKKKLKTVADSIEKSIDSVLGGGGGVDTGSGGGSTPPAKDPKPPKDSEEPETTTPDDEPETVKDDVLSILVTDQAAVGTEPVEMTDIRTLTPLVDPEAPFLVYVGKTASGGASFLVSADVKFSGDGICAPSPQDCRTLALQIGETAEFAQVADQSKKIAITITDVETKDVVVQDEEEGTKTAVRLENKARRAGAKALRSVLTDDAVVTSLARQRVKVRP